MPSPDEDLLSTFPQTKIWYERGKYLRTDTLSPLISFKRKRTTVSVVTPGYRNVARKRLIVNNPYSKSVSVRYDPQKTWRSTYVEYPPSTYTGEVFMQCNASKYAVGPQNVANADDPSQRALANLFKKLTDTKVNTLVTAAEMHKTVDLIAKTATRLYEAYRCIKRGDFIGLTRSLDLTTPVGERKRFNKRYNKAKSLDAQEHKYTERGVTVTRSKTHVNEFVDKTWLEYSYGWKPLLHDVYSHAQAIAETVTEKSDVIRRVKGRAKTVSEKRTFEVALEDSAQIYRKSIDKRWVEYGFSYRLQGGSLNTFTQFGIENPLEVVWELVPFSFVADWFIPVGEFIKGLTATVGLVYVTGYKSTRQFVASEATVLPKDTIVRAAGVSTYYGDPLILSSEDLFINRVWLNEFPNPEPPKFRNPFGKGDDYGLNKAMSSVALLRSLFLKRAPA